MITCPYEMIDGHLIAELSAQKILIDTGAPFSLGRGPLQLGSQSFPRQTQWLGLSLPALNELAGFSFDALMGLDTLNQFEVLIDPPAGQLTFSHEPLTLPDATAIPLLQHKGAPLIAVELAGEKRDLFFDTGAKISYLNPELTRAYPEQERQQDFYPGFGHFETPIHALPIRLAAQEVSIRFGHLPNMLQSMLAFMSADGVIGSELFAHFKALYAPGRQQLLLARYT